MENVLNQNIELECYEWCNFWWAEMQECKRTHVSLIGDSITNGYRGGVAELLDCSVDMLATSKAIDNENLFNEVKYALTSHEVTYKVVHFNNGLHGFHVTLEDYEKQYERMILHIQSITDAKLILALSTPVTVIDSTNILLDEKNDIILARNKCVRRLAEKYELLVDDLYETMSSHPEYRANDGFHYNGAGQDIQAKQVAGMINKI